MLFGDHVDEVPRWVPQLTRCSAFVAAANAAGGKAELIPLPDMRICGNIHMLMQDRNTQQAADILGD